MVGGGGGGGVFEDDVVGVGAGAIIEAVGVGPFSHVDNAALGGVEGEHGPVAKVEGVVAGAAVGDGAGEDFGEAFRPGEEVAAEGGIRGFSLDGVVAGEPEGFVTFGHEVGGEGGEGVGPGGVGLEDNVPLRPIRVGDDEAGFGGDKLPGGGVVEVEPEDGPGAGAVELGVVDFYVVEEEGEDVVAGCVNGGLEGGFKCGGGLRRGGSEKL